MSKPILRLLLLVCLATAASPAANDPFVGDWKLNLSKSKLVDVMKVASVAGNKYAFDFGGGDPETITIDGTDQPGIDGTTLSVTAEAPDAWKVVRKKDGRILVTGNWKLSNDGNTLHDDFTYFPPKGSATNVKYVYQRTAGTSGFAGTWEGSSETLDTVFVLKVQPFESDGLSFSDPQGTKNLKFDGQDHPTGGQNADPGSASSARRVNDHTLEVTDKSKGKIMDTRLMELSSDGKTLTITVRVAGRREPDLLVFDRQ